MIPTRDLLKRCDFALESRTPCDCTLSGLKTIVRLEAGYLTRSTHLCNPLNLPKSLRLQDFDGSKSEVISLTQQTGNDQTKISIQIWNSRNHRYQNRPLIRATWTTLQNGRTETTTCSSIFPSKGSPSKNPDIKRPLVVSFALGVVIHFSPLAACWCQGSS